MDIAGAIVGVIGRIAEGAMLALAAARAGNEEEAFTILEQAISETGKSVGGLREKIASNKAEAEKALDEKFKAAPNPTVITSAPNPDEPTKPE